MAQDGKEGQEEEEEVEEDRPEEDVEVVLVVEDGSTGDLMHLLQVCASVVCVSTHLLPSNSTLRCAS
jgi:hypothetical protein